MSYTKGEWKEVGAFVISEIKDNSWDDTPKIDICSTSNVNNLSLREQIANARLIAAAPDLLDALKGTDGTPNVPMVLAQALQGRNDVVISMLRELCSINANAITKAEQADELERTGDRCIK